MTVQGSDEDCWWFKKGILFLPSVTAGENKPRRYLYLAAINGVLREALAKNTRQPILLGLVWELKSMTSEWPACCESDRRPNIRAASRDLRYKKICQKKTTILKRGLPKRTTISQERTAMTKKDTLTKNKLIKYSWISIYRLEQTDWPGENDGTANWSSGGMYGGRVDSQKCSEFWRYRISCSKKQVFRCTQHATKDERNLVACRRFRGIFFEKSCIYTV